MTVSIGSATESLARPGDLGRRSPLFGLDFTGGAVKMDLQATEREVREMSIWDFIDALAWAGPTWVVSALLTPLLLS